MLRCHSIIGCVLLAAVTSAAAQGTPPPQEDNTQREIGRTTEKELKVTLTSSFGSVIMKRGEPEKMMLLEGAPRAVDDTKCTIDYAIRNRVGYLELALGEGSQEMEGKKGAFKISGFEGGTWSLKFSDAIPISFDVQLGVGKGEFDLTGLLVKDFNLSTGASDVSISFNQPNKTCIENINIESGVSKFDGHNLGNANFKRFHFQGGVGAYVLDFAGQLASEVDVDIEVGLGVLTIYVPRNVGARVMYDKSWASRVSCDADFSSSGSDQYISDNYYSSSGKMNIRIDSGLGSIKVRRN